MRHLNYAFSVYVKSDITVWDFNSLNLAVTVPNRHSSLQTGTYFGLP